MYSSILQYITAFIILFIILFSYCHVSRLKTINNELKILQAVDPTADIVYDLLDKHQPIILQREMLYWKEFNNLLGDSLINIKNMIAQNSTINYSEYIKNNIATVCELYPSPATFHTVKGHYFFKNEQQRLREWIKRFDIPYRDKEQIDL